VSAPQWHVTVDRQACDGTGLCVGRAPEHFDIDASRRSSARRSTIDPDEAVADAAECCPMEAIRVTEAGTGRLLYPQE
jgi:ferredoxin